MARLPRELSLVFVDWMPLSYYPDTSLGISVFLVVRAEIILRITTFKLTACCYCGLVMIFFIVLLRVKTILNLSVIQSIQ